MENHCLKNSLSMIEFTMAQIICYQIPKYEISFSLKYTNKNSSLPRRPDVHTNTQYDYLFKIPSDNSYKFITNKLLVSLSTGSFRILKYHH